MLSENVRRTMGSFFADASHTKAVQAASAEITKKIAPGIVKIRAAMLAYLSSLLEHWQQHPANAATPFISSKERRRCLACMLHACHS